jgi:hypothetical protein
VVASAINTDGAPQPAPAVERSGSFFSSNEEGFRPSVCRTTPPTGSPDERRQVVNAVTNGVADLVLADTEGRWRGWR